MFQLRRFLTFDFSKVSTSSKFEDNDDKNYVKRKKFGIVVDWLEGRHYDANELEKYRMIGDIEMDDIIDLFDQESRKSTCGNDNDDKMNRFRFVDVLDECENAYKLYKDTSSVDEALNKNETTKAMFEFYHHYHDQVPEWVDWDQIQRGIDVFILYSPAAGQSLYYQSLVPGFSIPKIAQVLQQTKYLAPPSTNKQVNKRLQDTGGFLMSCMIDNSLNAKTKDQNYPLNDFVSASSLRPGNIGWKMALRVRVLHAKVRRMLLSGLHKTAWDVNEYGIPINQEDMSATLLAFCVNVLTGLEFLTGVSLPVNEQQDYIALWRYIGWLLGVSCDEKFESSIHFKTPHDLPPLDPCGVKFDRKQEDLAIIHSRATLESIIFHLMDPNDLSCTISNHLLRIGRSEEELSRSFRMSFGYLYRSFICRAYIGNELANMLKIPQFSFNSMKHICAYALSCFILFLLRVYTLLTMYNKWFRQRAYERHRRLFNRLHSLWMEDNTKRMEKIASMSFSASLESTTSRKSPCPFSLVMPPAPSQYVKDNGLKKID